MAISLSTETQQRLEEVLKNGPYRSADDVVRAALDALNELETPSLDEASLDAIDRAESQIERGEVHDWNSVRDQVRAEFLRE